MVNGDDVDGRFAPRIGEKIPEPTVPIIEVANRE